MKRCGHKHSVEANAQTIAGQLYNLDRNNHDNKNENTEMIIEVEFDSINNDGNDSA